MAVRLGGDKMLCRGDESPFQTAQLGLILFTHPDKSCRESTEPSLALSLRLVMKMCLAPVFKRSWLGEEDSPWTLCFSWESEAR